MHRIQLPPNALVMLLGPAGSGKSTFARRHFVESQIVSSDECRRLVSDDEENQEASPQAFAVFRAIIAARLSLGRLTVADATNLTSGSRAELRLIAAGHDAPLIAIVLDVSVESCLAQNEERARNVRPEVIEWHHELFEEARRSLPDEGYAAIHTVSAEMHEALVIEHQATPLPRKAAEPSRPAAARTTSGPGGER